ncbi:MAG: PIG-L family deacetylase [Candidatus Izemoplasmatales bacterium]|nr:PIG-L family deacetylase [Candidatus Izemoplasmatales bacterium]
MNPILTLAPIPKLESFDSYLFIGPHPDDIEVGAGGLVSKLVSAGKRVTFLIVTDGGSGSSDPNADINQVVETRSLEVQQSATLLGVSEVYELGLPDGGEYLEIEAAKKIARIILEENPDVIVAPDPKLPSEVHPDHLKTGSAAQTAMLMAAYPLMARRNHIPTDVAHFRDRTIAFYYTHRANSWVELSDVDLVKRSASIRAHASQFQTEETLMQILGYLQMRGKQMGARIGKEEAEGYFVMAPVHQHSFPEINEAM